MSGTISGIGGSSLSMQELWQKRFNAVDTSQDGEIDSDELTSALSKAGSGGNGFGASVSGIMDTLDIDGSGTISKAEDQAGMEAMMRTYGPPPPPPQTEETSSTGEDGSRSFFEVADVDGDRAVTQAEFTEAMADMPQGVEGAPTADEIFSRVDTDGDGSISQAEDEAWVSQMATTETASSTVSGTEDALYQTLLEVLKDEKQAAALARIFTTAIETYAKNIGSGVSGADGTQAASVSAVC